jgi:hypothetical protein
MNDNTIPPALRRQPSSAQQAASPAHDLTPAEHSTLSASLSDSPLSIVLDAAGHSRACILGIRSGRNLACSCKRAPEPLDDAATAVGLAIRFAQIAASRQIPIPRGVICALVGQVDADNAAAILVWHWLARRGQIPRQGDLRPRLRVVCERS